VGPQATGGGGSDILDGIENLHGSSFNDKLTGNSSANEIDGGAGNDMLDGGAGNDRLVGGVGNDTLTGGLGTDSLEGGAGNDIYNIADADLIVEASGGGTDTVQTALASYTLPGNVENLTFTGAGNFMGTGNALANTITGQAGQDTLFGGDGGDKLNGGLGNDVLDGGTNNDILTGGTGGDTQTGGSGADTFVFLKTSDFGSVGSLDRIADFFTAENDKISLKGVDPDPATAGDQAFTFIGSAAFTSVPHTTFEVRYQAASGGDLLVELDTTRDGAVDFSFLVRATSLAASDFLL
jgi:Ca2+-binding RTX toxin-like protein